MNLEPLVRGAALALVVGASLSACVFPFSVPAGGSCFESSDCEGLLLCVGGICGASCQTSSDCPQGMACAYASNAYASSDSEGRNGCEVTQAAQCVLPGWYEPEADGGWALETDGGAPPPACGCDGERVPWVSYGFTAAPVRSSSFPCRP